MLGGKGPPHFLIAQCKCEILGCASRDRVSLDVKRMIFVCKKHDFMPLSETQISGEIHDENVQRLQTYLNRIEQLQREKIFYPGTEN